MGRGVNKVTLIGTLGHDPEVKYMPSGGAVANISIATNEEWKDKQSGEKKERTEWHNLVFYQRLAEIVGEYLTKGSQIYVEGKLHTRKWQDKSGNDRYTTEIVVAEMQMLGGGNSRPSGRETGDGYPKSSAQRNPTYGNGDEPPPFDDDIPF